VTDAPDRRRRLTVVVFADVAGYTELSSRDEDAALAVVDGFREVAAAAVEAGGGRIVKHLGDGLMAAFESVDGALGASFALQTSFAEISAVGSAGVRLRVGVHLGEVTEAEDGDLYGDGVNTAARVQALARPGDVAISDAVHRQVRNRSSYVTLSIGTHHVKGLPEPIEVWAVGPEGAELPAYVPVRSRRQLSSGRAAALGIGAAIVTFVGLGIVLASSAGPSEPDSPPVEAESADASVDVEPGDRISTTDTPADSSDLLTSSTSDQPAAAAIPPPTSVAEAPSTRQLGTWFVSEAPDSATGARAITVAKQARQGQAVFGVRCLLDARQVNAAIVWPREVATQPFQYAIDRVEGSEPWSRGPDRRTSVFGGDLPEFMREVARSRSLTVRAPDTARQPMTAAFDLAGASRALAEVRQACAMRDSGGLLPG